MSVVLATEKIPAKLKNIRDLHSILMDTEQVTVLDIETTGFSPEKHSEIIEIGAVKLDIDAGKILGVFSQLIRPSEVFSIPARITELTTIDWAQVADKPFIEDVLPAFGAFLGDAPIVAHNASFDWPRFLIPAFQSVGLHATNEAICSMLLAKALYPERGRSGYNLESLCNMYGVSMVGHHRACVDCKWTASLFRRMLSAYRETHALSAASFLETQTPLNCPPSMVGQVDFNQMRINKISFFKGSSPRHGSSIYVSTNFGRVAYSTRRHLWTVKELWTDKNAPAQEWGSHILKQLALDVASFVEQYKPAC